MSVFVLSLVQLHVRHTGDRQPHRPVPLALLLLIGALGAAKCSAQALRPAEQDLLQGRVDQVLTELKASPASGTTHLLLCRAYLSEGHGTEAAAECRLALQSGLDHDAAAQDWAGRAFGMEAQHAGPIAGLKLAGQVRNAFQTAYDLDHRNPAAANDLGEYFVNAPFIVGGGVDKASSLANNLQSTLPELAHRIDALVAEKRGDEALAEKEFIAATQVSQSPGAYVDLATFYVRQGTPDKALAAARRTIALDRSVDANVVEAASVLNDLHQPSLAIPILRTYLDHGLKSDQAPAFRVHVLLGGILASQGDTANARKEYQQALALASGYAPARKGLASL